MWLLDEKSILQKSRSRLGETLIFKVSVPIVAKFRAPKMDAKSDMEKRCKTICKKKASGLKFGALGCVLDGLGRARGVPRAAQERPKTAPRAEQGRVPRGLLRSWALLGTFLLFFESLFEFWSIFRRFLLRKNFGSWVFLLVLLAACCCSAGV